MKISEYLKSLGNTSEEVADSLRAQGIKGIKQSHCRCPILNAIYKACPDYWSGLKISDGRKIGENWYYHASLGDCQIMDPVLPQAVNNFIREFDNGKYPDLEANSVKVVTTRIWE